mgnify:CR=1 FL=1
MEGWTAYCSTQAGMQMLTRMMAMELAGLGVRVHFVGIPPTDTAMQGTIRQAGFNPISKIPQDKLDRVPDCYVFHPEQKMKLYDGRAITGYTQDSVKELRKESEREGLHGISPRYVQDKISNALVSDKTESSINPFLVLNELEGGLKNHSLISNEEERNIYRELLSVVRQEYEDIVKNEVQRAISADEEAISKLAANWMPSACQPSTRVSSRPSSSTQGRWLKKARSMTEPEAGSKSSSRVTTGWASRGESWFMGTGSLDGQ